MTDRGRVRVANTGRVIGRPPGVDHPRGATRGRLVSRTQRAFELTECSPWPDDSYDSTMFPLPPSTSPAAPHEECSPFASREHVPPPPLRARNEFSVWLFPDARIRAAMLPLPFLHLLLSGYHLDVFLIFDADFLIEGSSCGSAIQISLMMIIANSCTWFLFASELLIASACVYM
jgi:hypothetical protein